MIKPRSPLLYQVNTRIWLNLLSQELSRPVTLDDLPDAWLEQISRQGFDWVYLLGVWQTGEAGRHHSLTSPEMRHEFKSLLPDLIDDDICGSCFAITGYSVAQSLGGDEAMLRLRDRLNQLGLRLMLDFVPNHTATDHPWVVNHPEFFIHGRPTDLKKQPDNFVALNTASGIQILAHGRDPYFSGWVDTLQLNYSKPALQQAMKDELIKIASLCDGVRCDMAMLILPEVFTRTWGLSAAPFWPEAIQLVRQDEPDFTFMAEVYWDMEPVLLEQGFDFAYDKHLLDVLIHGQGREVHAHFEKSLPYQDRLAHFLENHDEKRATDVFPLEKHQAAAGITFLSPGLRFFHQGQLAGSRLRVPVHLCRGPKETPDPSIEEFYARLLECLQLPAIRLGSCQILTADMIGLPDNPDENLIGFAWQATGAAPVLVLINYSDAIATARLDLDSFNLPDAPVELVDRLNSTRLVLEVSRLKQVKPALEMPAWMVHVFEVEAQ